LGINRMTFSAQANHLYRWLRALLSWLCEARLFWLAAGVVIAAMLYVARKGFTEPEIRITGLVLQILGIGTVAWGIRETRMLFGRPDIFRLSRDWMRRFPVYGGRVVTGSVNITVPGATARAHSGGVSVSVGPNVTVQARVEALEKKVHYLNERIDQTQAKMDQKARAQRQALEQEQQTRTREDHELRAMLEVTETGGLHISLMGALWLFVGITMSTAAPELAKWLN
jgi:outer membrane murein-binding lipoprotein Lpp